MALRGLSLKYENSLVERGFSRIIGIDEVGRGAWAGPLILGVFTYTPDQKRSKHVNDSKVLPRARREALSETLNPYCRVVEISVEEIDNNGLGQALNHNISRIIEDLLDDSTYFLIDGKFPKVTGKNFEVIVDGDAKIYSIAAASIVAKVYRDNLMRAYIKQFPKYGFEKHVGYGTRFHREAISKYGICPIHRKSYKPIMPYIQ